MHVVKREIFFLTFYFRPEVFIRIPCDFPESYYHFHNGSPIFFCPAFKFFGRGIRRLLPLGPFDQNNEPAAHGHVVTWWYNIKFTPLINFPELLQTFDTCFFVDNSKVTPSTYNSLTPS